MIRALLIDDEQYARQEMSALLKETGRIEIVGSCSNSVEALKEINRLQPEVLFLDIQMPVIDGFELLNMINNEIMPHVVFVTAYDQYSLQAFEEKTLDYLLKPIDPKRLEKTVSKLAQTLRDKTPSTYKPEEIKRLPCVLGSRIKLIPLDDIEYVTTTPAGVHAVTDNTEYFTEVTLKAIEERTPLFRCHKQFLVNIDHVNEIMLLEGGLARILTNTGNKIPVSRRYLKMLKKQLLF